MNATGAIEQLANAVLYEGYLLYPYRLSSVKNRQRWNFGVLYPEPFGDAQSERSQVRTECLVTAGAGAVVDVKVRFLQLVDGTPVERDILVGDLNLAELSSTPHEIRFPLPHAEGSLEVQTHSAARHAFKLAVCVSNLDRYDGQDRDEALARSLISLHVILTVRAGKFLSLIDPPEEFQAAAAQCRNVGLWPVLAGAGDTRMLAAPIILYDHPQIAQQSPGDLFDGTEIDEILTLRIQTLAESEKSELRGGDARVRALLERSEALSRDELLNLHASMRGNTRLLFQKGDRVRLHPRRRADIFDIALAGKLATILSVEQDFENRVHVCVTVDDDPGRDLGLEGKPGHRFFFDADEVEPA